ncbi:MAG: transglutaminase-like domain-containing protein, partial [Oscillospiraceae bacterium]
EKVYNYTMENMTYDQNLALHVQSVSGYLPVMDDICNNKTGICFDYASFMTAMLRLQNIPTKLVVGWSGDIYHAWISVYMEETGWVDGIIQFNGNEWKLMDPTFADNANQETWIMEYIGNGGNYSEKYVY